MAMGGYPQLGQADVGLMIDALQRDGQYVVLSQEEFQNMRRPVRDMSPLRSSSRIEPSIGRGALMRQALLANNRPNVNFQDSINASNTAVRVRDVPKLPIFSGDDNKNEASYDVWRFELKCLLNDNAIDDSFILQAVRRSLRGTARQMLIPLGENASCTEILGKLDTLFGNVSSSESVLQKFYTEVQKEGESVTNYGCRLENLLQIAIDSGHISASARNDMLRSKFWTGLRDDKLKTQTRHKFDSIPEFNFLFKEIRAVEQELSVTKIKKPHVQAVVSDTKVDKMAEQMEKLLDRLKILESKIDRKDKLDDCTPPPQSNNSHQSRPQQSYRGRQNYHDRPGPGFGRGNFGGPHGGATGRGNPSGRGWGRGQYQSKD